MRQYLLVFHILIMAFVAQAQTPKAEFFPMLPVYKNGTFSKVFMGLEIPYRYIRDLDRLKRAKEQLASLGLQVHEDRGRLLGTVKFYKSVSNMIRSTTGILFVPTSSDTLYLGEQSVYGFKISLSPGLSDLQEKKGFSLSDPISTIIEKSALMINGDTAFDVVEKTVRYGLFWNRLFNRDGTEIDWPEARFEQLKSVPKGKLLLSHDETPAAPSEPLNAIQGRTAEKISGLTPETIAREKNWHETLIPMNDQAPLWNQVGLQTFVQNICTDIAQAHNIPKPLFPECRVFSTLKMGATSYPGGDIFLTAGLIASMENIDTLLFLISHEIAHEISRHATLRLQKEDQANAFYNTVGLLASALSIASMGTGKGIESTLASIGVEKASPYLIEQASLGLLTEFGVEQEREADLIGFEMALRMGAQKEKILDGLRQYKKIREETYTGLQSKKTDTLTDKQSKWDERIQNISNFKFSISETRAVTGKYQDQLQTWKETIQPFFEYYQLTLKSQE